jgi:hypothetical protein
MAKNPDPKYGRYILPFVIAGMVGATFIFVNGIEPGTVPDASSTTTTGAESAAETIPESTTSTTLPPEIEAYIANLEPLVAESEVLVERARQLNNDWDNGVASFQDTADGMRELSADTADFANRMEAAATVPALEPSHLLLNEAARAMATEAENMVSGLLDPDSSEGRILAFEAYQLAADSLQSAFVDLKVRAGNLSASSSSVDESTEVTEAPVEETVVEDTADVTEDTADITEGTGDTVPATPAPED